MYTPSEEDPLQYMLLVYNDPAAAPEIGTPEAAGIHEEWNSYTAWLNEQGTVSSGAGLQGVETATTVRVVNDDVLFTDGPFAETKEILVGYYVIDVADLDAALTVAAKAPNVTYGSIEVRPVMVYPDQA
ncbi:MAG: YciI family protein [Solirubrobacteraceae bacterium]|nr:YciI family protein [Patulibacter sp.]